MKHLLTLIPARALVAVALVATAAACMKSEMSPTAPTGGPSFGQAPVVDSTIDGKVDPDTIENGYTTIGSNTDSARSGNGM